MPSRKLSKKTKLQNDVNASQNAKISEFLPPPPFEDVLEVKERGSKGPTGESHEVFNKN